MSKRILTAALLGLAVASNGVFAQSADTTGNDRSALEQQKSEQKAVAPDYRNDDSPNPWWGARIIAPRPITK